MQLYTQTLIATLLFNQVVSHMEMSYPTIPRSRYDNGLEWYQKDYTNIFPIGNQYHQDFPYCHNTLDEAHPTAMVAGSYFETTFAGDANHDGGHCEFSLSYDGTNFAVIHTIISECLRSSNSFSIKIPEDAPSGDAIFSWTWVNRIGEREFYMNCAKVKISNGPKSGSVIGPKRLIVNLPGFPTIHQFRFSVKGVHLYRNRTSIVTGINDQGVPTFNEIDNTGAEALPGKNYFYDPAHPCTDPTEGFPDFGRNEYEDD